MRSSISSFNYTEIDQPVSMAVLDAVAEAASVDQTALPPLYEWIDVDAIERLFKPTPEGTRRAGSVTFVYYGYEITIDSDLGATGTITVRSADTTGE